MMLYKSRYSYKIRSNQIYITITWSCMVHMYCKSYLQLQANLSFESACQNCAFRGRPYESANRKRKNEFSHTLYWWTFSRAMCLSRCSTVPRRHLAKSRRVRVILSRKNRRGSVGPSNSTTLSLSQGLSLAWSLYLDDCSLRSFSWCDCCLCSRKNKKKERHVLMHLVFAEYRYCGTSTGARSW